MSQRVPVVPSGSNDRFRVVSPVPPIGDRELVVAIQPTLEDNPTTDRLTIDRRTRFADLPEYLSPEEFRAYVGMARSTIYDLLRRDEIPHQKFGKCIRIPKAVLREHGGEVK
jgi:excisionase family DNA binding protein